MSAVAPTASPPQAETSARGGIESLLLDFLAYLELERGLSRNTLEAYRSDLLQFGAFLERRGVHATDASHGDLAAFIAGLSGGRPGSAAVADAGSAQAPRPAAAATLGRKVACLRSFHRHLRRTGVLPPERILAVEEEHANDMHDLLVAHEGRPMLPR